jgi:hypothetical protein
LRPRQQFADLIGRAELVAAALDEQHRQRDGRQVRVAPLLRPSRRMQRITEEHQAAHVVHALRAHVRRDPSAHRLAADEERQRAQRVVRSSLDDRGAPCASSTGALSGLFRPAVM